MRNLLFAALAAFLATGSPSVGALEAQRDCPRSGDDWGAWRSSLIDGIRDRGIYGGALNAKKRIDACSESFVATIGIEPARNSGAGRSEELKARYDQCFGPIEAFVDAAEPWTNRKPDSSAYRAQAEAVNPKTTELPPELVRNKEAFNLIDQGLEEASSDTSAQRAVLARIEKIVKQINPGAKVLVYSSRHLPVPGVVAGALRGRVLIYYPGKDVDRWLQAGVPSGEDKTLGTNVSMVSVVKQDKTGQRLDPAQAYFQDFFSEKQDPRTFSPKPVMFGQCRLCHESGVNPLWPKPSPYLDTKLKDELNDLIGSYGKVEMPGLSKPTSALSPSLGATAKRDLDHPVGCSPTFAKRDLSSRQRILGAMSCNGCHDGVNHVPVTIRTDETYKYVWSAIGQGEMPPGNSLSAEERRELFACLIGEVKTLGTSASESGLITALRARTCDGKVYPPKVSGGEAVFGGGTQVRHDAEPASSTTTSDSKTGAALPH